MYILYKISQGIFCKIVIQLDVFTPGGKEAVFELKYFEETYLLILS